MLTFNIAHGRGMSFYQGFSTERRIRRNLSKITDLLLSEGVDVAALQEVDFNSHWNKNLNLLEIIQRLGGYQHAEMGIHNVRGGDKPLSYGNGIVSNFPMHYAASNPFGTSTLGEKGFLYVELDVKGNCLPLINLHLDFRSKKKRVEQVELVIDYILERVKSEGKGSPIICGDFNSGSNSFGDAIERLFHGVEEHGGYNIYPENARTFPAQLPSAGIDFILLPKRYKMLTCEIVKSYVSDHRPVLMNFEIN